MPRILRIFNRMIIGGPALHVSLLTKYLPEEYETKLIIGSPDVHEKKADFVLENLGIQPIVIPDMNRDISMVDDIVAYRKIKAIIKKFKPDIVHTHASKPGAIGRWAAAQCGVPVILHTFHGHIFHSYFSHVKSKVYIEIEKALAKKSTRLIAISNRQKEELVNTFKIAPAHQVEVIPLGLDLQPFTENKPGKRLAFRNKYQLQPETIAIGIIGRLAPIKHHELFIDAIRHAVSHSSKKVTGFIVGDGECRESLINYCNKHHLEYSTPERPDYTKPIIFTSWHTDIDVVNAGMDIITLTSLNEGTPVSIIEAQASAKPVVATICGGIEDVVMPGKTALLSEQHNREKFFENLMSLIENESLREEMSRGGEIFALGRFGYQRLISDMDHLYKNLIEEKACTGYVGVHAKFPYML